MAEPAKPYI